MPRRKSVVLLAAQILGNVCLKGAHFFGKGLKVDVPCDKLCRIFAAVDAMGDLSEEAKFDYNNLLPAKISILLL